MVRARLAAGERSTAISTGAGVVLGAAAVALLVSIGSAGAGGPPAPGCFDTPLTIEGSKRPDMVVGTEGRDVIETFKGADVIDGRGGNDLICTGEDDDRVMGGAGDDMIIGGDQNDELVGDYRD